VPGDVLTLLAIVFATFSLQWFDSTAIVPALLRLSRLVWQRGFVWQLATYPFAGVGEPGFFFLLELVILFMFARDVFDQLGRRVFWRHLLMVGGGAALVACLVQVVIDLTVEGTASPFVLMQGQHALVMLLIATFARLRQRATILLFFVLPVEARWFVPIELVGAFLGFLRTRDLAGFLGLCAGVGLSWALIGTTPWRRLPREVWLRLQAGWMRLRLSSMRRRRGLRVVRGGRKGPPTDPWVH
jgi:hypothetical protein